MIKKILAVVLAAVLVVLCFAACGKKPKKEDVYGVDQPVAYNDNGYAIFNDEGFLRVYDTDEKGNIKYDSEGNPEYKYYDVGGSYVHDETLETPGYAFKMPSGWKVKDNSTFTKNGTDGACNVKIILAEHTSAELTFEQYVDMNKIKNEETVNQLKESGSDVTMDTELFTLGQTQSPAYAATYLVKDADGKVMHYAVSIYYLYQSDIYLINYICEDGAGYDESFDFLSYVKENFVTK